MSIKSRSKHTAPSILNHTAATVHSTSATVQQAEASAPPLYSPEDGKKALAAIHPLLAGIDDAGVVAVRVDVEPVIFAMLGVAGLVQSAGVRTRFERLPKDEFDMSNLDGLSQACFATLYTLAEARAAGALETDARIPAALSTEARTLKRRMRTACEYHLSDDPVMGPQLALLRPGSGHRDDANDLLGYARVYELRHDILKTDTKHFRAGDAGRAKELGGIIIQALSKAMTSGGRDAYSAFVRCWTLAHNRYDEVRQAALWLFRNDATRDERFPSIYVVGRPNVGRPRKRASSQKTAQEPAAGAPAGATATGK